MRKLKGNDKVDWRQAGLTRPAPPDKRRLKLALREIDLPPTQEKGKVVLP